MAIAAVAGSAPYGEPVLVARFASPEPADAGDAGVDAGPGDAGAPPADQDAGTDAAPVPGDGSPLCDQPGTVSPGGCGCSTAGAEPSSSGLAGLPVAALAILLLARRRPGQDRARDEAAPTAG
jgi:MYXO-CTERM domain-containing protein